MFDKTAKDHLERIRTYFHNIQEYCPKAKVMLIGSKCENLDEIVFSSDDIQKLKEEYKVKYMDASAKDNINVAYIFHSLLEGMRISLNVYSKFLMVFFNFRNLSS